MNEVKQALTFDPFNLPAGVYWRKDGTLGVMACHEVNHWKAMEFDVFHDHDNFFFYNFNGNKYPLVAY